MSKYSGPVSFVEQAVLGDNINHPKHYTYGKIECIDVIEDWRLDYNLGNVVKYVARAQHKGNLIEDLKKARWYIERALQRLEGTHASDEGTSKL